MPSTRNTQLGASIKTKVRIPGPYEELLRESARRNMRSYSAEIALAIARYIEGPPAESAPRWERGSLVAADMRLPADIYGELARIANTYGRSRNQEIILAVERHLKREGLL